MRCSEPEGWLLAAFFAVSAVREGSLIELCRLFERSPVFVLLAVWAVLSRVCSPVLPFSRVENPERGPRGDHHHGPERVTGGPSQKPNHKMPETLKRKHRMIELLRFLRWLRKQFECNQMCYCDVGWDRGGACRRSERSPTRRSGGGGGGAPAHPWRGGQSLPR